MYSRVPAKRACVQIHTSYNVFNPGRHQIAYSVYQHWDPLKVCVVGRSYPPEFYSWIKVPHVRNLFEKIAMETEEDYQNIVKKLQSFDVTVLRPDLGSNLQQNGQFLPPPMTPRDTMVMIGGKFYQPGLDWDRFYRSVKDPSWPWYQSWQNFQDEAESWQIQELKNIHNVEEFLTISDPRYTAIITHIVHQGNQLRVFDSNVVNGAMVSRIGRDLYFGTRERHQDRKALKQILDLEFPNTRNHVINTVGHTDGTYCPVCPGLIISLLDIPTYAETFPDWEVVYLPGQSWSKVKPFLDLKKKNQGRWWLPGFEQDQAVIDVVETWLSHWVGYVEETVFDVNMLIIDPKNVMVVNENDLVFKALDRYGITPHVVPFRHRHFWDGGIHCITLDLDRTGQMQNFFRNTEMPA